MSWPRAFIILMIALPFNECSLSGQSSVARSGGGMEGGTLWTPLSPLTPYSWSSCPNDFLTQQPDFESTDERGDCQMTAATKRVADMYQLLALSLLVFMSPTTHYPASSSS